MAGSLHALWLVTLRTVRWMNCDTSISFHVWRSLCITDCLLRLMFQPLQKGGPLHSVCWVSVSLRQETKALQSRVEPLCVWSEESWLLVFNALGCRLYQPRLKSMTGPTRMQRNSWKNYRNWVRPSPMGFAWWVLHGNSFKACVGLPEQSWLNMIQVSARDCRSFQFATMTWHGQKCFRQVVLCIGAYHSLWHQISS